MLDTLINSIEFEAQHNYVDKQVSYSDYVVLPAALPVTSVVATVNYPDETTAPVFMVGEHKWPISPGQSGASSGPFPSLNSAQKAGLPWCCSYAGSAVMPALSRPAPWLFHCVLAPQCNIVLSQPTALPYTSQISTCNSLGSSIYPVRVLPGMVLQFAIQNSTVLQVQNSIVQNSAVQNSPVQNSTVQYRTSSTQET